MTPIAKSRKLRLPPVFAAISLILALMGGAVFVSETGLVLDRQIERDAAVLVSRALSKTLQAAQDMETAQRGYLLTGRDEYLAPFERGSRDAQFHLDWLRSNWRGPSSSVSLARLSYLLNEKERELRETVRLHRSGRPQAAMDIVLSDEGRLVMNSMRQLVDQQTGVLYERQAFLLNETKERLSLSKIAFFTWLSAIALLLAVALVSSRLATLRLSVVTRRLALEATHDPLTRLPNRRYLSEWLDQAVAQSSRSGQPLSALYLDLDGFSQINNTLGHDAGDQALIAACSAFRPLLRASDFLARVGGDEFVIISPGADSTGAASLGQRLIEALDALSPVEGSPVGLIGVSVGVACFPERSDAQSLLAAADAAMYDAKRSGKRKVCLYSPSRIDPHPAF